MGKQQEVREIDQSSPILQQILGEGTQIANPDYNPKKKGKKANLGIPKTIYDSAPKAVGSSVWDNIADNSQDLKYNNTDLGLSVDEFNNYSSYGANPGPYTTKQELDTTRANNQSALEQTGHAVAQAVGNEVVLGTALGLSNLVDAAVNVVSPEGTNDYTNPISSFLEDTQNDIKKRFDIYQKNPDDKFQLGDYGWWASNSVSVASTLSLLIPSLAVTKGLSIVGELAGLEKVSLGIAKAAQAGKFTKGAYTLAKAINTGAEIGTSALLSRTMENYQEARGVYKDTYDKSLNILNTMAPEDRDKLIKNNPDFAGKSHEEIASIISGKSADETFKNDYAMLLMDFVQFKALGSMWKGLANKEATGALRLANKAAIADLAGEAGTASEALGFIGKRKEALINAIAHPLTSLEAIQLSEGFEEGFQGVQTEKGKEVANKIFDPNYKERTLGSYLTDNAIWEQAFWGAVGGIAFQGIGTGLGNISEKVKGKINKSKMTEQEYALSQLTDEKIREQEINSRKSRMQDYTSAMQLLNQNKNPFGYVLDPDTKQPIITDGSKVNSDISKEDADQLKTKLTNDFVTNMTMDAIDKGNYDLFRDYVEDPNFNKFFDDAGLKQDSGDRTFGQMLTDKMDDVNEQYHGALYDVLNSVKVDNENVAKIVARSIARRKLDINDINNTSDDLANQIAEDADNSDYLQYEENERVKYAQDRLNEIADKETTIQKLLDNKNISPQAVKQISKENDIRRNQLLAFASANNMFGNPDAVRDILKSNINDADTNAFISQFNDFLESTGYKDSITNVTTPKKSIQDIIKKKIELDDHADYLEKTLPTTQANYQSEYDDVARNVDRLTIERYNKAADAVSKYIEDHPNLDEARDNIMSNNVNPELKAQLDILKLGHYSTQRYASQINALIREVNKDREEAAANAKNVVVDNNSSNGDNAASDILDINAVVDQTDDRPVVDDNSSTGEESVANTTNTSNTTNTEPFNPETVVPFAGEDIKNDIDNLDRVTLEIEQQRANDFILDNDSRAAGLASSITFNLFKTSRNLFDNLQGKDVNSVEFNNIVSIVADELFTQGVSRGYTKKAAVDGVRLALSTIYRRLNAKGVSGADTFKRLADEVATKYKIQTIENAVGDNQSASTTTIIPNNEFNKVIEDFIDSYIDNRGIYSIKGSKTIINIEDLFKELLNNESISYDQAKHIFFNISDYIRTPNNSKYIFTNKTELNKNLKTPTTFFNNLINNKTTIENVDNYMHIAAPSKLTSEYNKALKSAINGGDITVSYYEGEFGKSDNSISIKSNGQEIGYLGSVVPNSTNTGYSLKKQNQGFVYNLNNINGVISSNLDKLFIPLINKSNQSYSDLMDIAYKQFVFETAYKNGNISNDITEDDANKVLSNPAIKELVSNGDIKIPEKRVTNKQRAQYILTNINNILFYDANAVTSASILDSYSYWKKSTYDNYNNTHKVQLALNSNKKITTKLVNISQVKVLIDINNHDVNSMGFTYEQNPIMIVNANGNIINETSNNSYSNVAGFEPGTMGMLITDNPSAPIIALFTEANKLSTNGELANRTYNEISNLLSDFQNKNISFDVIGSRLSDLFSGPGIASNNLFTGYSVVKTSDKIALNIQGQKGQYNLIIHKFEKGSNTEGSGITYIPNGDQSKSISSVTTSKSFNNKVAREIVSNLNFNKTFYAINNKHLDNEKSNNYIYKKNGKLIIDIGGKVDTYNSFGHFVLTNNAFKTNQGRNSDGSYFDVVDKVKSLYIDTAIATSPVEELNSTNGLLTASDIIKSATKTDSVNTSHVLTRAGIDKDKIAVLTGDNEFNIELIPKESYFDNKATKAEAYYSNGKMFFTNKGANNIAKSGNNLVRLLIHENLHAKFEEQGLFQQANIVGDLLGTYQSMIDSVNSDIQSEDKTTDKYKQATAIQRWLNDNKFNPAEYFTTLSVEQQKVWNNKSAGERGQQFAEEWLIESLTQPTIIKYLNSTIYNGEDISVEGIDNSNKTIWQKIIDVLLKLFGRNTGNIKNNTILAQQYSILGNTSDTNIENEIITDRITDNNSSENTPGETTLDTNIDITDTSINNVQQDNRKLDEQSDVDDLDFAITSLLEDPDNIKADLYKNDDGVNVNGIQVVTDMNKYIDQFALQDKPLIAKMMARGEVKFRCE